MATDRGGIPPATLQRIRDTVDIVEIISRYVTLSKTGQRYRGLCPFHHEKTPSFTVNPTQQMFYCFGCSTGGDVFSFLMSQERFNFLEAVTDVAQQVGIDIPQSSFQRFSQTDRDQRKKFEHLHGLANAWFQGNLYDSTQGRTALTYLQTRGLTMDTLKEFGVGFALPAWDALTHYLLSQGAKPAELVQAGLVVAKESSNPEGMNREGYYDRFRSRVMVPIRDLRGNVIAFGGRIIEDGTPKYLNSPETLLFIKRKCLFGLDRARDAACQLNTLFIVEGYFDVLVLHQFGIHHAVAPLGTALTAEHVSLIRRFVNNVVLLFDGDAAGVGATLRAMEVFLNSGVAVNVVQLPSEEDPDSYIRAHGAAQVFVLQRQARPLVEFAVEQCLEGVMHLSVEERTRRMNDVLRILSKVSNPIEKEDYLKQVAERSGIRQVLLIEHLQRMERAPSPLAHDDRRLAYQRTDSGSPKSRIQDQKGSREERAIVTLLVQGRLSPDHLSVLCPENFLVPDYRDLVEMSRLHIGEDGKLNDKAFRAEADLKPERTSLVAQLAVSEQHFDDCDDYTRGCLHVLERRRLNMTLDQFIARLRVAEREHRLQDIDEINTEIEALRKHKAGLAVLPPCSSNKKIVSAETRTVEPLESGT